MAQVFRDCCRDTYRQTGALGVIWLWFPTLIELVATALNEHLSERSTLMAKTLLSSRQELKELILELTESAKKNGVLSLPDKYHKIGDDFMKHGLQLVVDGVDPDVVKETLNGNKEKIVANISSNLDLFIGSVLAIQMGNEQEVKRLCDS